MPGTSIGQSHEGAVNIPVTTGEIPGSPVTSTVPERDLNITDIKPPIEASPDSGKTVNVPVQAEGQNNAALNEAFGAIDQAATSGEEFREDAPAPDGEPVQIVGADTRAAVTSSLNVNDAGKSLAALEENVSIDHEDDPQTVLPTAATVPGPLAAEPVPDQQEPAAAVGEPVPEEKPGDETIVEPAPVREPAPVTIPVAPGLGTPPTEPAPVVPLAPDEAARPVPESQSEPADLPAEPITLADIPPDEPVVVEASTSETGMARAKRILNEAQADRDRDFERLILLRDEIVQIDQNDYEKLLQKERERTELEARIETKNFEIKTMLFNLVIAHTNNITEQGSASGGAK